MNQRKPINTKKLVVIAFMGALSYALMLLPFPIKYMGFLEVDLSDIPAAVSGIAFGPMAAVFIEVLKNAIKALTASSTGGIGEVANMLVGIAYMVPFALVFRKLVLGEDRSGKKKLIGYVLSSVIGTVSMAIMGIVMNYFVVVPVYAKLFGGMDAVIGACKGTIPVINNLAMVVIVGITPFNIFKGILVSIVGILVFQRVKGVFARNVSEY